MQDRLVSHYEVLDKLGEGGMGVVYKARDVRLDRLVALKCIAPHLLDSPQARRRFVDEARTLSSLNHPHIAILYDVIDDAGSFWNRSKKRDLRFDGQRIELNVASCMIEKPRRHHDPRRFAVWQKMLTGVVPQTPHSEHTCVSSLLDLQPRRIHRLPKR